MAILKDRRVILAGGAGVALAAGLLAAGIIASRNQELSVAPPASQGGLMVQTGRDDDIRLDPSRPLRCFVGGQLVGELPLSACAKRNGVATGALDVGLDPSGALAASHGVSSDITPLPPPPEPAVSVAEAPDPPLATALADEPVDETPRAPRAMAATCWRYGERGVEETGRRHAHGRLRPAPLRRTMRARGRRRLWPVGRPDPAHGSGPCGNLQR